MAFPTRGVSFLAVIATLVMLIPAKNNAQIAINSPYTRYGLGLIVEQGLNPRTSGMGGLHFGLQKPDLINPANSASYVAFDTATFLFDAGVFGQTVTLRTNTLTSHGNFITLSHLLFGFPVTGWWKTSLGVLPFSWVGYSIYNEEEVEEIGTVRNVYRGSGGLNQLYWGNAFRIGKKFSVGFNLKYLFGTIDRFRGLSFPDSAEMKTSLITASLTPSDLYGDIGIQYKTKLPKDLYLVAGASFGPQIDINAKVDFLSTTFFGDITSTGFSMDTIGYLSGEKTTFTMPIRLGSGFTLGKENQWMAGADFSWQNWKAFEIGNLSDSLYNMWNIAVGGEYSPNYRSITSYFQRMTYRMGAHYGKMPVYLKGKHIDEFGISFGLTLPIAKSRSTVNLSAEFGRRGTTVNNLIQENYFRFTLGVNILERWFVKSKYF
jgi:hypothetical protein